MMQGDAQTIFRSQHLQGSAMSKHAAGRRRGINVIAIVVVLVIVFVAAYFFLAQIRAARESARGNTCRNNMRGLATALFDFESIAGAYPGYINALKTTDGKPQVDPQTGQPVPMSWVVMILPGLDQEAEFEAWRKPGGASPPGPSPAMNIFQCPSGPRRSGPFSDFVVNTGMPDAAVATIGEKNPEGGVPRDWRANGMFFDYFSESPLLKPDPQPRGPTAVMRYGDVEDLKSRTIMMTENVDGGEYLFTEAKHSADGWRAAEIQAGCVWRLEKVDGATNPTTKPAPAINVAAGEGDGKSFDYCRPSSGHPGYVNVAMAEVQVSMLRDKISYFVYAKLMASDDKNVALPGRPHDPAAADPYRGFREYELTEGDVSP
jgi:hypothetical protein